MLRIQRRLANFVASSRRCYTSYPDPNEKPRISTHIHSSKDPNGVHKQILNKSGSEYVMDSKFRLDTLFPGVPVSNGGVNEPPPQTKSTKLANGLTLSTQEMHGLMSSFTFILSVGSSSEIQKGHSDVITTGVTQVLELLSFGHTTTRTHQQLSAEMEALGGMVQCISTREQIMFCVDVLRHNLPQAMALLADTVLNPRLSEEDISQAKEIITLQGNEMSAEMLSRDAVTIAAFEGSPLGNTHFCPADKAVSLSKTKIESFREAHFVGSNCHIAAAGVEHASFVALANSLFFSIPTGQRSQVEKPVYRGGLIKNQRELQETYIKCAVAFEIGGWKHQDLVTCCVIQQLLGGGSSFSAGGPGKGMYTRLYREMLNQHHWVESAEAFLVVHDEAGLLGIDGSCEPDQVRNLIREIVYHLCRLSIEKVSDEELSRAKNMLKSMMLMQLESRLVLCEDIGRQVVIYGKRSPPAEICTKIDAVSNSDILSLVEKIIGGKVSVGCAGHDLSHVPTYDEIDAFVQQMKTVMKENKNRV